MARYLNEVLLPDEEIRCIAQLHWIVYAPGLILGVLSAAASNLWPLIYQLIFGIYPPQIFAQIIGWGIMGLALVACYLLLNAYIQQRTTELAITNQRVLAKYGFISRTTFELFLERVEGANVDQSLWGRIFGFGSVLVKGTGGGFAPIDGISSPRWFQQILLRQISERRESMQN